MAGQQNLLRLLNREQAGGRYPLPESSDSMLLYRYDDNPLGLPQNPAGDAQFPGGIGPGSTGPEALRFLRSQLEVNLLETPQSCSTDLQCSGAEWCENGRCRGRGARTFCTDMAVAFRGDSLQASLNIGSVSLLEDTTTSFVMLARWDDRTLATTWRAVYDFYDADGDHQVRSCKTGLDPRQWYRWCTTFDLESNQVLHCDIKDVDGSPVASRSFTDAYLNGGMATPATPDQLRLFSG